MKWKQGRTLQERFWDLTDKRADVECWPWLGGHYNNGYGHFYIGTGKHDRKTVSAHKAAYFVATGEWLQSPIEVRHTCDNHNCVNPGHLLKGTRKQNMEDAVARRRTCIGSKQHMFKHGHYSRYLSTSNGKCWGELKEETNGRRTSN